MAVYPERRILKSKLASNSICKIIILPNSEEKSENLNGDALWSSRAHLEREKMKLMMKNP